MANPNYNHGYDLLTNNPERVPLKSRRVRNAFLGPPPLAPPPPADRQQSCGDEHQIINCQWSVTASVWSSGCACWLAWFHGDPADSKLRENGLKAYKIRHLVVSVWGKLFWIYYISIKRELLSSRLLPLKCPHVVRCHLPSSRVTQSPAPGQVCIHSKTHGKRGSVCR